jgi:hypothetical protein
MHDAGYIFFTAEIIPFCINLAEAFALDLEAHESNAEALVPEIVPSEDSSSATIDRHLATDAVDVRAATHGLWLVTITGAAGVTGGTPLSLTNRKFVSKEGKLYTPISPTAIMPEAQTSVAIVIRADEAGSESNLDAGEILTWTAAPTRIDAIATVSSVGNTAATDGDTDTEKLANLRAYRRGRPASGSPAWWCKTAEDTAAVYRCYCYPNLKPNVGAYAVGDADLDHLGTVTNIVLGQPQGDSTNQSYLIDGVQGAEPAAVRGYFLGTYDVDGNIAVGEPRYPGVIDPTTSASFTLETPILSDIGVDLTLTLDALNAYPWSGTLTVNVASTRTALALTGDQRAYAGKRILVFVGTSGIRGGYQIITLPTFPLPTYDGVKTTFDLSQTPLNAVPSGTVYPAPGNWESFRLAMFSFFDNLGPGDVPDAIAVAPARAMHRRRRYPPQSWMGICDVTLSRLAAAVLAVPGIVDVAINTPVVDQIASPKQMFRLTTLLVH